MRIHSFHRPSSLCSLHDFCCYSGRLHEKTGARTKKQGAESHLDVTLIAVLPEERYKQNGTPLRIEATGTATSFKLALKRAFRTFLNDPALNHKRPVSINFAIVRNGIPQLPDTWNSPVHQFSPELIAKTMRSCSRRARTRFQHGSLTLRGKHEKKWAARFREDFIVDGQIYRRQRKEVLGTLQEYPTKRLAQRALAVRMERVNKVSYRPTTLIRFGSFAEQWKKLVLPNLKPSSQVSFRAILKKWLIPRFGEMFLWEINNEMIQKFISDLSLNPKTVRNVIGVFRVLWKAARQWQYVDFNCFEGLRFPQNIPHTPRFFTIPEMQKIISAAEEPFRSIYWVLAETGIRSGELCGLRVDDLDLERGLLSIRQSAWQGKLQTPKTPRAVRHFLLSPDLVSHLGKYLSSWKPNEQRILFPRPEGTPMIGEYLVRYHLHPLLKRLGIPKAGGHAFRHGNSSAMDHFGAPLRLRQDRLGHADPSLTIGRYTHVFREDEGRLVGQFGAILNPESNG